MNFLNYTPDFLKEQLPPIEDSASSLHAPNDPVVFALGDEMDFSSDADRPVKINL